MHRVLVLFLLLQTACAGTASYVRRESASCLPSYAFSTYVQCIDTLLSASRQPEAVELKRRLPDLEALVQGGRATAEEAIGWVDAKIEEWYLRESDSMQSGISVAAKAVAVAALVAGTVAVAYALSRNEANARGCCSWHGGISHCGYTDYYVCTDGWVSGCKCK